MDQRLLTGIQKSERITRLINDLFAKMPEIEADRAELITESYKQTESEPIISRRAKAFAHILRNIPITIREGELIVGSSTKAPRGCQTFPEFSFEWLENYAPNQYTFFVHGCRWMRRAESEGSS